MNFEWKIFDTQNVELSGFFGICSQSETDLLMMTIRYDSVTHLFNYTQLRLRSIFIHLACVLPLPEMNAAESFSIFHYRLSCVYYYDDQLSLSVALF